MVYSELISFFTFPGVVYHQFCVVVCCRLAKLEVQKVIFFQLKKPVGYVLYKSPKRLWAAFLLVFGPLVMIYFASWICLSIGAFFLSFKYLSYLFFWIAFSLGSHAFPVSFENYQLWELVHTEIDRSWIACLWIYPFLPIILFLEYGGRYGVDKLFSLLGCILYWLWLLLL